MAVIKKAGKKTKSQRIRGNVEDLDLSIDDEATEPSDEIGAYSILLYGERKIGKTSLCAQFPGAFFMFFEPGGRALRLRKKEMTSWGQSVKLLDVIGGKAGRDIETVIVDTSDYAFKMCFNAVCSACNIEHPSDVNDFGKTWNAIAMEFDSWVRMLLGMGKGVVFISHAELKTITKRDGSQYDMLTPTMTSQAMKILEGLVDNIFYYGYTPEGGRELVIRGDAYVNAGSRIEEHFKTPKGRSIHSIDMGGSARESYENILKAWENKLTTIGHVPTVAPKKKRK